MTADELSAAYASALDGVVASSGAAYWIHGHTHYNVRYRHGETCVLSNQRGYPDEPVEGSRCCSGAPAVSAPVNQQIQDTGGRAGFPPPGQLGE